jgi:hypothetical protein
MLNSFARKVIETSIDVSKDIDIIPSLLPTEEIDPGDTFVWHELYGAQVWYGTYGAAARLSRPMLKEYTATTNLKEVGLKLDLTQIQTGKYSPSELGEFTAALINAWRQRLLFTTTINGNSFILLVVPSMWLVLVLVQLQFWLLWKPCLKNQMPKLL